MNERSSSGMGIAVGLLICGLLFLVFPNYTGLSKVDYMAAVTWICYVFGFIILLIGALGTCIELFK